VKERIAIRPAAWSDRDAVLRLIATVGGHDGVAAHDGVTAHDAPLRTFGAILRDPDARALVAEWDGRVVGVVAIEARSSLSSGERCAWLGMLAVAEDVRGCGVGRRLLAAVDDAARSLGCAVMRLSSGVERTRAHAFFRANEFVHADAAERFYRAVAPSSPDAALPERFLALAARAASAVDSAIAGLAGEPPVGIGADGARTEAADAAAERAAIAVLAELGVAIVSEEAGLVDGSVRKGAPWIALDPLDGSRNFLSGHAPYAVAMGLVADGIALAGFVCELTTGRRWWASRGRAYRDGSAIAPRRGPLLAMPSATGTEPIVRPAVPHRLRISGSLATDLCEVADGSLAAFVATQRPIVHVHDLAGPAAILRAAGATLLDGRGEVPRLSPDPRRTYAIVAAADRELAESLRG
jgi:3'(2'), 5'-bisphosphate nucleotidase